MFTAMVRRPIVWLLATLALLGAGWAAYGPLRDAWQPAPEMAGRGPQPGPAPVAGPPPAASASRDAQAAAEAPPAAATPETPAAAPAPAAPERPPAGTPAPSARPPEPRPAAAAPAPAAPERQLAGTPAPTASPPESRPSASAAGPGELAPAPAETAAEPVPESGAGPSATAPGGGELAPAAGPAAAPAARATPASPLEPPAERAVAAAAPEAAPPLPPEPAVIGPSGEPPARAAAVPGASPEARQPPPASVEHPSGVPEVAETTPLPATEPAPPATNPEAAAPPARRSLSLDTIRRALAALLGGTSEPTDPAARRIEPPAAQAALVEPGRSEDLTQDGAPAVVRPSFDLVRVEPGGRAVVAGRAAPGAEVELLAGQRVLDRVRADRRGEWVAMPPEPLPPGGLELGLRATSEGAPAVEAEQVALVVVPEPPPPQPAPVAVAEGPPPQPAPVRQASSGPFAVLLAEDGRAPGRILQAPGRISSDGSLALLMLDYDDSGRTRLTGEAPPGAPLRIYVDNQPAAETIAAPSGKWTAVLEHNLAPGEYTLRLDQLGNEGRPVARLETPFTRVSQPPIQGKAQVDYVIVQPGNSLWRIARRLFGSGMEFVQIYDANKAQIRDPDLIYPGQVFEVPPGMGSSG